MATDPDFRTPPQPDVERARRTEALMQKGGTDTQRWAQAISLAVQWDERALRAGAHIPGGAHVLDIGCGAMALRKALKLGCRYTPCDVVSRAPECLVADLNKGEFPHGRYDWVTLLGVLEYIHDPAWVLMRAKDAAPRLLFTYCCDMTDGNATQQRRGMGWVNDLSLAGVRGLLEGCGWRIVNEALDKKGANNHQMMFVCGFVEGI